MGGLFAVLLRLGGWGEFTSIQPPVISLDSLNLTLGRGVVAEAY